MNQKKIINLKKEPLIIGSFFFVALVLRLWGWTGGYPYLFHPDEEKYVINAFKMAHDKTLDPGYYVNPPLFSYLLLLLNTVIYAVSRLLGSIPDIHAFSNQILNEPNQFVYYSRILSAVTDSLFCFSLYLFLKNIYDRKIATWGAVIYAACLLCVREAHFGVPDTLTVLIVGMGLYYLTLSKPDFYKAAFFIGLSVAAKYTAFLLLIPLFLQVFHSERTLTSKKFLLCFLMLALGFLVGNPYILINPSGLISGIKELQFLNTMGWFGVDYRMNGLIYYLKVLSWGNYGLFPVLVVFGTIHIIFKTNKYSLVIYTALFWIYLFFLSSSQLRFERFALLLFPFAMIIILYPLSNIKNKSMNYLYQCILLVLVIMNIYGSIKIVSIFNGRDSRIEAKNVWSKVDGQLALDDYSIPYGSHNSMIDKKLNNISKMHDYYGRFGVVMGENNLRQYKALILSSYTFDKYRIDPLTFQEEYDFYYKMYSKSTCKIVANEAIDSKVNNDLFSVTGPIGNLSVMKMNGPNLYYITQNQNGK